MNIPENFVQHAALRSRASFFTRLILFAGVSSVQQMLFPPYTSVHTHVASHRKVIRSQQHQSNIISCFDNVSSPADASTTTKKRTTPKVNRLRRVAFFFSRFCEGAIHSHISKHIKTDFHPQSNTPAMSSMPKKKDPRLRAAQAQGAAPASKQYFDSVEYEVQRQQAATAQQRESITTAARSQPHAGLPSGRPLPPPPSAQQPPSSQ